MPVIPCQFSPQRRLPGRIEMGQLACFEFLLYVTGLLFMLISPHKLLHSTAATSSEAPPLTDKL